MVYRGESGHIGSMLSAADILAVLYNRILNVDASSPDKADRDRLIFSKGHGGAALFATLAEKFGFVGGSFVIAFLFLLVFRILVIARNTKQDYGKLICVGVAAMIVIQSIINLGMCLVILPVIGVTLPFVSAGGSSVLATYIIVGMVHSVNAARNKYFLE